MGKHTHYRYEGQQDVVIALRLRDSRLTVLAADGRRYQECDVCPWCERPMRGRDPSKHPHPLSATIEHIRPRSAGGTDNLDNLVLVHDACNKEGGRRLERGARAARDGQDTPRARRDRRA